MRKSSAYDLHGDPGDFPRKHGPALLKKCDRLFPKGAQLFQGLIYDMHLHLRLGIGLIYHMNDVVRILSFFQGTLEGFYQIGEASG